MKHHPACKPHDLQVSLFCEKCGNREAFDEIVEGLELAYNEIGISQFKHGICIGDGTLRTKLRILLARAKGQ